MKNTMKKISALLLVLMLTLSMTVPTFAADPISSVTYVGGTEKFVFLPGSGYTDTDLLVNFKDVMPGDTPTQTVEVINSCTDCDYIKLYMRAVLHDDDNPLTYSERFENTDGKDQAKVSDQRDETVATMEDFLSQLTMRVYNEGVLIYEDSPNKLDGLANAVYLGRFDHGDAATLKVELEVPVDLGNEYAARVGEVDWKFTAEQFNYSHDDDDDDDETYKVTVKKVWKDGDSDFRPKSIKVKLTRKGKTYDTVTLSEKNNWRYTWRDLEHKNGWDVEEVKVPDGYKDTYSNKGRVFTITNTVDPEATGQLSWPIPVLAVAGLVLMGTGASLLWKGKGHA